MQSSPIVFQTAGINKNKLITLIGIGVIAAGTFTLAGFIATISSLNS